MFPYQEPLILYAWNTPYHEREKALPHLTPLSRVFVPRATGTDVQYYQRSYPGDQIARRFLPDTFRTRQINAPGPVKA